MNYRLEEALTGIGAVTEIARFVYLQMVEQGFTKAQAFQTAQKAILQCLPSNKSSNSEE